jgi:hypothetical protein
MGKEIMIKVQKALATRDRSSLLKRLMSAHTRTINQMINAIMKNQKIEPAVSMVKGIASFKFTAFHHGAHQFRKSMIFLSPGLSTS